MTDSDNPDNSRAPIIEHLKELRTRLLYSFVALLLAFLVCFYFSDNIFNFLAAPLSELWQDQEQRRMIFTALHEKFFTDVKIAFFAAFCVAFPVLISQIWLFVAPGLFQNEKKAFLPFLLMTPVLFLLGASFVYYLMVPVAWEFFLGFEQAAGDGQMAIVLEPKVSEYLSLVMRLILAFGVCFELPVLLVLLVRAGITDAQGLITKRRYAILLAFVVAAIVTPPDPISQISLAIPIILLYEISIICAKMIEKKAAKEEAEDTTDA